MPEVRLKKHKWWLVSRIIVAMFVVFGIVMPALSLKTPLSSRDEPINLLRGFIMLPAFMLGVYCTLNLLVFPFNYSMLGKYERSPFPKEEPVRKHRGAFFSLWSWVNISLIFHTSWPLYTWSIYATGVGIEFTLVGKAFIPVENIVQIKRVFPGIYRLRHSSPEVRNPIYFSDSDVYCSMQYVLQPSHAAIF